MATLLLGIPFDFAGMAYYQTNRDVVLNDLVVCPTEHGTYLGIVKKIRTLTPEETAKPNFSTLYPSILRIADFQDKAFYQDSLVKEKEIAQETQKYANNLKLDMKVLQAHLDVEDDKVLITFSAEQRVDFRELVRVLNGLFHLRIELRQIGPRDQAKSIGGLGPCGLPLCCSTFLSAFDGISISMAKNQLLAINIPKLSGQCGKLMCCLKFEDEAYSKIRPLYPKIGEKFAYRNSTYSVSGLNLLNDTITCYNGENYESFTKEEYERVKKGLEKETAAPVLKTDVNAGVDLSGHGITDTNNRIAQIKKSEEQRKEDIKRTNTPVPSNNRNPSYSNNNHGRPTNNNNQPNRSYGNKNPNFRPNNRNAHPTYHANPTPTSAKPSSSSGFIPVSQIADKSVLEVKPVKKDDKK
jgi:cell fate regulator YaaT (PSP1 superfamily)